MMSSINNIREAERLQFERDRQWREYEIQIALMQHMYSVPTYRIEFSAMLPDDRVMVMDRVIHVPESQAYKWIFFNNVVNESNVQFAINHAIRKVHRFIDNYKV